MSISGEILWFENHDIESIVTPVDVPSLERLLLETNYGKDKVEFLVEGFTKGFKLGYQGPLTGRRFAPNHKLRAGSQVDLWNKLMKEVQAKRCAGPWLENDIPFDKFLQSPITLIDKKGAEGVEGTAGVRLIFDLSWPRGDSLNDHTPQELKTCEYPLFDKAVQMCLKEGKGCFMSSADCKSAFKQLPLAPDQFCLVVMMCEHPISKRKYYFCDKTLCFGSGTSCFLYMKVSNALAHIFKFKTRRSAGDICNFLDDFQTCKLDKDGCNRYLEIFIGICKEINLPLAEDKITWATQVIVFLGLLLNSRTQTVSIPIDKIERGKRELDIMVRSKKTTVRQIQKLAGLLNFFCRAVVPGRAFTRRFYSKIAGMKQHYHLRVDTGLKSDCKVWENFLNSDEAVCRPFMDFSKILHADELDFYCDAALNSYRLGIGGRF